MELSFPGLTWNILQTFYSFLLAWSPLMFSTTSMKPCVPQHLREKVSTKHHGNNHPNSFSTNTSELVKASLIYTWIFPHCKKAGKHLELSNSASCCVKLWIWAVHLVYLCHLLLKMHFTGRHCCIFTRYDVCMIQESHLHQQFWNQPFSRLYSLSIHHVLL